MKTPTPKSSLNSTTEESSDKSSKLQHQPEVCVCYCMKIWLNPWRTRYYPSMGRSFTAFCSLRDFLYWGILWKKQAIFGHLWLGPEKKVYDKLGLYWEAQKARYISGFFQAMIWPTHCTQPPLYAGVLSKLHPYTLGNILEKQQKLLRPPLPPMYWIFTHSMGLLCFHNLLILCQNKSHIRFENIHPRWFFDCTSWPTAYLQPSIILDPLLVARRRGWPRAAGYRQVLGNNQSWEREEENKGTRKIGVKRRNLQQVSRSRDWRQDM